MWKIINCVLDKSADNQINSLNIDGVVVTTHYDIVQFFNNFFIDAIENIAESFFSYQPPFLQNSRFNLLNFHSRTLLFRTLFYIFRQLLQRVVVKTVFPRGFSNYVLNYSRRHYWSILIFLLLPVNMLKYWS